MQSLKHTLGSILKDSAEKSVKKKKYIYIKPTGKVSKRREGERGWFVNIIWLSEIECDETETMEKVTKKKLKVNGNTFIIIIVKIKPQIRKEYI